MSTTGDRTRVREALAENRRRASAAPDFGADREWLNVSRPLSLSGDLRGRLVLVDFWTYCCINCIHVLPDLAYLEERFKDDPFVVVGCHSAKFTNEGEARNILEAIRRYRIEHPVVNDDRFEIWRTFGVRSWPSYALIGPEGTLLFVGSGEGQRELLELLIDEALRMYEPTGLLQPKPIPMRLEVDRDATRPLSFPAKLAVDAAHLFISDSNHDRIVITDPDGQFVDVIGDGTPGLVDGSFEEARFDRPQGLALDGRRLWIADTENHAIRLADLDARTVKTIAGTGLQGRDRAGGGGARDTDLNSPWDLLRHDGALFIAMAGTHQLWRFDLRTGLIAAFAGDGSERKLDGSRSNSALAQPSGLTTDGAWLYFADSESSSVRACGLGHEEDVVTLAGANEEARDLFSFGDEDGVGHDAKLQHPLGVLYAEDDGVVWIADTYNHRIKSLDPATRRVTTIAGTGEPGDADGPFAEASFREPSGFALDPATRRLYVADTNGHRIRVLDLDGETVTTLELRGVPVPPMRDGGDASA